MKEIRISLDEFDDDDIIERALELIEDDYLLEETEKRGYSFVDNHYYPHNDIVSQGLLERFNDGFGEINKKELEIFLQSQKL